MDEKPQVPPAIMLRQLAHVMRASRALYAAAELGIESGNSVTSVFCPVCGSPFVPKLASFAQ